MKPSEAFGVAVRFGGVALIFAGVVDLLHLLLVSLGLPTAHQYPNPLVLLAAALWIGLGLAVLAGARWIVRLVYGRDNPD